MALAQDQTTDVHIVDKDLKAEQLTADGSITSVAITLHGLAQELYVDYVCLFKANPWHFILKPGEKIEVPEKCCMSQCNGPICSKCSACPASTLAPSLSISSTTASVILSETIPGASSSSQGITTSDAVATSALNSDGASSALTLPSTTSISGFDSYASSASSLDTGSQVLSQSDAAAASTAVTSSQFSMADLVTSVNSESQTILGFGDASVTLPTGMTTGTTITSADHTFTFVPSADSSSPETGTLKTSINSQSQTVIVDGGFTLTLPTSISSPTTILSDGRTITYDPSVTSSSLAGTLLTSVNSQSQTVIIDNGITVTLPTGITSQTIITTDGQTITYDPFASIFASTVTGSAITNARASDTDGTLFASSTVAESGQTSADGPLNGDTTSSSSLIVQATTSSSVDALVTSSTSSMSAPGATNSMSVTLQSDIATDSTIQMVSESTTLVSSPIESLSTQPDASLSIDTASTNAASSLTLSSSLESAAQTMSESASLSSSAVESQSTQSDTSLSISTASTAGAPISRPSSSSTEIGDKSSITVLSQSLTTFTMPPGICATTIYDTASSAILTYRNPTASCMPPSSSTAPPVLYALLRPLGKDPPPPGSDDIPCSAWFFIFCIRWGDIELFGFRISFPPGILPPGPPPKITFPPELHISVNTEGPLPDWPSGTVDPQGRPTFSPKPSDCVETSGAICMTSTSFAVTVNGGSTKTTGSSVLSTCNTIYGCKAPSINKDQTTASTASDTSLSSLLSLSLDTSLPSFISLSSDTSLPSLISLSNPSQATSIPSVFTVSANSQSSGASISDASQSSEATSNGPQESQTSAPGTSQTSAAASLLTSEAPQSFASNSLSSAVSSCASTTVTDCSTACSAVSTTGSLSTTCYSTTCSARIGCSATGTSTASTSTIGCPAPPAWPPQPSEYMILGAGGRAGYVAVTGWVSPTATVTITDMDTFDDETTAVTTSSASMEAPVTTLFTSVTSTTVPITTLNTIESRSGSSCALPTTVLDCVVGPPCGGSSLSCASWVATTTSVSSVSSPPSLTTPTTTTSQAPAPATTTPPKQQITYGVECLSTAGRPTPTASILDSDIILAGSRFCADYRDQHFDATKPDINVVQSQLRQDGTTLKVRFVMQWLKDCKAEATSVDTYNPVTSDITIQCYTLYLKIYSTCPNNNRIGGYTDVGCMRYAYYTPDD